MNLAFVYNFEIFKDGMEVRKDLNIQCPNVLCSKWKTRLKDIGFD